MNILQKLASIRTKDGERFSDKYIDLEKKIIYLPLWMSYFWVKKFNNIPEKEKCGFKIVRGEKSK